MQRKLSIPLALACLVALPLAFAQERVRKKEPASFEEMHAALGEAWKAGQYGRSLELGREMLAVINEKRTELILSAMPAAPAGWEAVPEKKKDDAQANPFAGAMAASIGNVVERRYRETDGRGTLEVTVTAGSPIVQMFKMWVTNPQMLGPDAEHIRYEQYDAVLKKESNRWSLQILMGDDLCEVRAQGPDDELLLKFMDQAAVDALARALSA